MTVSIESAAMEDAGDSLALQQLAYPSEGAIYADLHHPATHADAGGAHGGVP